jgi:hypothetical protein
MRIWARDGTSKPMLRWSLSSWIESQALAKANDTIRQLRAERVRLHDQLSAELERSQFLRFRLDEQARDASWVPAVIVWRRAEGGLAQLRDLLATARKQIRLLQESHYAARRP